MFLFIIKMIKLISIDIRREGTEFRSRICRGEDKMNKNRVFLVFIVVFCLNFCLNNASFAIQDSALKSRYPDYSYEFNGKDTCEKFNRKLFVFNLKLNKYLLRPVNIVWASIVPKYGITRLQNAYNNVNYPVRLVSCLVQKDCKSARSETVRFLTNTTLGVGGLYDPAKDKFKIEPRQEDMEQALAYRKVKKGPYVVLPVVRGSVRDLVGKLLDCPLNPCSYVLGPFSAIASTVFFINNTTCMQPLVKRVETTYADPYEILKQVDGVERYIRNSNLDRSDVLGAKLASQGIVKINNIPDKSDLRPNFIADLKPDVELNDYNPQGCLVDSLRTVLFEDKSLDKSIWSEISIWNKSFSKKIKTSSVNIAYKHPNYKYRYILQKDKTAPLAIIYPSIGEGITSDHSTVMAKILYDEGYSVLIQGSSFQWEFVKSMPDGYKPGFPSNDAKYLRLVTSKILDNFQNKMAYNFNKKIIIGSSFGALTTLFVAAQEEDDNTLNVSNYISINPPIEIMFALQQLDKYCQDWQNDPSDIKLRAAITAEKVVQVIQKISDNNSKLANKEPNKLAQNGAEKLVGTMKGNLEGNQTKNLIVKKTKGVAADEVKNTCEPFPFTDEEAKLIISFIMKQKLSDVVFALEHGSISKKNELHDAINNMSFNDYAQKYLLIDKYSSYDQLTYDTGLYSLAGFLQNNKKYKIYHTLDDYFVNPEQLVWLKKQSGDKSVFFSNGSHLGFLYRKEFMDEFKKDISFQNTAQKTPQLNELSYVVK